MSLPELPQTTDRRELRKALVRLRLEMRRQEIRHESGQLLKPLTRLRGVGDSLARRAAGRPGHQARTPLGYRRRGAAGLSDRQGAHATAA